MPRASDSLGRMIGQQMERGRIGVAEKEAETNRLNAETAAAQQSLQAMLGPIQAFTDIGQLGLGAFEAYEKSVDRDLAREELARKVEKDKKLADRADRVWPLELQNLTNKAMEGLNRLNITKEMAAQMQSDFVNRVMSGNAPEALNEILAEHWGDSRVKQTLDPRSALGPHQEPLPFDHPQAAPIPYDMREILKKKFWAEFEKKLDNPDSNVEQFTDSSIRQRYQTGDTPEGTAAAAYEKGGPLWLGPGELDYNTAGEAMDAQRQKLRVVSGPGKGDVKSTPSSVTAKMEGVWITKNLVEPLEADIEGEGELSLKHAVDKNRHIKLNTFSEVARPEGTRPDLATSMGMYGGRRFQGGSENMRLSVMDKKRNHHKEVTAFNDLMDNGYALVLPGETKTDTDAVLRNIGTVMTFLEGSTEMLTKGHEAGATALIDLYKEKRLSNEQFAERMDTISKELKTLAEDRKDFGHTEALRLGKPYVPGLEDPDLMGFSIKDLKNGAKQAEVLASLARTPPGEAGSINDIFSLKDRNQMKLKSRMQYGSIARGWPQNAVEFVATGEVNTGPTILSYGLLQNQSALDGIQHNKNMGDFEGRDRTSLFTRHGTQEHIPEGLENVENYYDGYMRLTDYQYEAAQQMVYDPKKGSIKWRMGGKDPKTRMTNQDVVDRLMVLIKGGGDKLGEKFLLSDHEKTRAANISGAGKDTGHKKISDIKDRHNSYHNLITILSSVRHLRAQEIAVSGKGGPKKSPKYPRVLKPNVSTIEQIGNPHGVGHAKGMTSPLRKLGNSIDAKDLVTMGLLKKGETVEEGGGLLGVGQKTSVMKVSAKTLLGRLKFKHLKALHTIAHRKPEKMGAGTNEWARGMKIAAFNRLMLEQVGFPTGWIESLQE